MSEYLDGLAATILMIGFVAFVLGLAAGVERLFELYAEKDER